MNESNAPTLKLPRDVEVDPRRETIEQLLQHDRRLLWEGGTIKVAHVPFTSSLIQALAGARRDECLERGFERMQRLLDAEKKGLLAVHEKKGTQLVARISRLLIIPDECGERFYRNCEELIFHHADRVLGLRVTVPYQKFGSDLFGSDALAKAVLVSDRKAAAAVLFSLVS
jgi:hypothetical protein